MSIRPSSPRVTHGSAFAVILGVAIYWLSGVFGLEAPAHAVDWSKRLLAGEAAPKFAAASPAAGGRRANPLRAWPDPVDPTVPTDVDRDLVIPASSRFGDGFLVWESVRSGNWRIWTRNLDGSGLAQLSPDEGTRQHCCPHIAPDGSSLVYLSAPPEARHRYPPGGMVGNLHRITFASATNQVVAVATSQVVAVARDYGDHRVAVWRNAHELIHLDAAGRTTLLDLNTGRASVLIHEARPDHGWLLDASLSYATSGRPSFSPFDRTRGTVDAADELRGCEPYFSLDGTFGYFVERGGGPIRSIRLASRALGTILDRADPRLPSGFDYVYFPMLSADKLLFAFGASRGIHDQFLADYEIFVARFDAATLELIERPTRFTAHPATDRFPDLWARPGTVGGRPFRAGAAGDP